MLRCLLSIIGKRVFIRRWKFISIWKIVFLRWKSNVWYCLRRITSQWFQWDLRFLNAIGRRAYLHTFIWSFDVKVDQFLRYLVLKAFTEPATPNHTNVHTYIALILVLPLSIITSHISQKFVTLAKFSFFSVL